MQPVEEISVATKSFYSSIMLPVTTVIMHLVAMFLNLLTPMEKNSLVKRHQSSATRQSTAKERSSQYVLVTGCDRGLGYAIAKKLDKIGYRVLAGCLDAEGDDACRLRGECSDRLTTLPLDVTNREQLERARLWLINNLRGRELRGVVNNAGVCFVGAPEVMAQSDLDNIVNVNFHGTVNVTRTFLPFVRRCQGRVVNMGSLNGDVPMPFFSIYNATKAAIKTFTESLSYEMMEWGVKVSLVAPAGFKTGIIMYDRKATANKWWAEAKPEVREDYGNEFFKMPMRVSGRVKVSDDFGPVLESVVHALSSESPRAVYRVGQGSVMLPTILRFAPASIRTFICGSMLNFISGRPKALEERDASD